MRIKEQKASETGDVIPVAEIGESISADEILSSADREELEELRAERDARKRADKAIEEAAKREATSITLDLPPAAGKGIQIAGKTYFHGMTYQVSNDLKWSLEEQQRRCWAHESSLHESENKGRKKTYRAV